MSTNIKIEQRYVLEAKRIILEYDKVKSIMGNIESTLEGHKAAVLQLQSELEKLKLKPEPEALKEQEMYQLMTNYEKTINKLQNEVKPHIELIEGLKKSSHLLYGILKEQYPGASDVQLRDALNAELAKLSV